MPFKIVETQNKETKELCICPSNWEKNGILTWPLKKSKKLSKIEDCIPKENWTRQKCLVKRYDICSYEMADKELTDMLDWSTTATEYETTDLVVGPTYNIDDFNVIATQALTDGAATVSKLPEQMQIEEPLYAHAVNQTTPSNNETTSVPIVAIDPSDLEKITSNQVEIYNKQEAILNDLSTISDNYKKVLENQQSILMVIAHISVKFDTLIAGQYEPQCTTLNDAMKKTPENTRFYLKPIQNIEELSYLEATLNDDKMKQDYKNKYSIVCHPGKAENCAYQLVDVFFTREFLTTCSWSGSTRGEGTKVCLKQYKNVLQLFFELIYECDHTYTFAGNEKFFKSVLKNAIKRKNSKLQRSSTCRNSHKKQKMSENPVNNNELSEEGTSNESQHLEDNVYDNHIPEHIDQQIVSGQENDTV